MVDSFCTWQFLFHIVKTTCIVPTKKPGLLIASEALRTTQIKLFVFKLSLWYSVRATECRPRQPTTNFHFFQIEIKKKTATKNRFSLAEGTEKFGEVGGRGSHIFDIFVLCSSFRKSHIVSGTIPGTEDPIPETPRPTVGASLYRHSPRPLLHPMNRGCLSVCQKPCIKDRRQMV